MSELLLDAHLLAGPATDAGMRVAMWVASALDDAQWAIEDEDPVTALESVIAGFLLLRHCLAMLEGRPTSYEEGAVLLLLEPSASTERVLDLPPVPGATMEQATAAHAALREAVEEFRRLTPVRFPEARKPEGLLPTIRLMRELDRLRGDVGLVPYEWDLGST